MQVRFSAIYGIKAADADRYDDDLPKVEQLVKWNAAKKFIPIIIRPENDGFYFDNDQQKFIYHNPPGVLVFTQNDAQKYNMLKRAALSSFLFIPDDKHLNGVLRSGVRWVKENIKLKFIKANNPDLRLPESPEDLDLQFRAIMNDSKAMVNEAHLTFDHVLHYDANRLPFDIETGQLRFKEKA